jgi:hypothetical protein
LIHVVPFSPDHLTRLRIQATQAASVLTVEHGWEIVDCNGIARTALRDGEPVACAGLIPLMPWRAFAWSYLGEGFDQDIRAIHRATLGVLNAARYARIEMAVDPLDSKAKRWAWHLGFEREGLARKWAKDRDMEIWARVT